MPRVARTPLLRRWARRISFAAIAIAGLAASATAAPPPAAPAISPNTGAQENPLRTADEATRQRARAEAWITFQRSCRPCHGNLGAGDGPYGVTFAEHAADLRRPSRDIAADAVRFSRIRDGASGFATRPWTSAMPAFGGELDDRQIWGLVLLLDDLGREASGLDPNAAPAEVYAARCAACHGATGAGDGPLAKELLPAPRSFVKCDYRFRSTQAGAAPLDTDIIGSIVRGLGPTSMGKMIGIGGQQVEDIAKFLFTFAPDRFAETPPAMTGSPLPAGSIADLAARGREVYQKAGCAECHGLSGRGDGPKASTLKDDTGRPSIATDLTRRAQYKGGASANEIFRTLSTGMNGTPMPSFDASLSGDERWVLAHYLERAAKARPRFSPTVQASIIKEAIPLDPLAELWQRTLPTSVMLGPQIEQPPYWTQPSVDLVDLVVTVNDEHLGILLVWNDATKSVANDEPRANDVEAALRRHGAWRLPDRIALQLPEKLDPKGARPPLYLGDAEHPVLRWSWSADRLEPTAVVERIAGPSAAPEVVDDASPVQTAAAYADGQWRVLLLAKRPPKSQTTLALAVHAWEGSHGEAGAWQSLSSWLNVNLR